MFLPLFLVGVKVWGLDTDTCKPTQRRTHSLVKNKSLKIPHRGPVTLWRQVRGRSPSHSRPVPRGLPGENDVHTSVYPEVLSQERWTSSILVLGTPPVKTGRKRGKGAVQGPESLTGRV